MRRKNIKILLHWSVLLVLALHIARRGEAGALALAFALAGLGMAGLAIDLGRPKRPTLQGFGARKHAHPFRQWFMYAFLALTVAVTIAVLLGYPLPGPGLYWISLWLASAICAQAALFRWRHEGSGDSALRRTTPGYLLGRA